MKLENFLIEEKGTTAVVQINRPKALNALNSATLEEFFRLLTDLDKRNGIRAVILTGSGDKAFIAGADISEMSGLNPEQAFGFARKGQKVTELLEGLRVPVIAAVNGYALGGGCEMAIACDFILASSNAVFGQPEVTLGLITGFGGAVRLADYVGWPMARELIYSGRRIKAEEALRIGLVNRVVDQNQLMPTALAIAEEISCCSPAAIKSVKQAMLKIRSEASISARLDLEAKAFASTFSSFDQKEGTRAFVEKRKPVFRGE